MGLIKGSYKDNLAQKNYLSSYPLKIIQREKTRGQKIERKELRDVHKN